MNLAVWSPLKIKIYRFFWICAFISNLGASTQDVASGWVMTHLSTSPLIIALLSFTNSLPILFLSIPAGYLADLGYRRQVLLLAQGLMFAAAATLAYLVYSGSISELSLVVLSFMMGIGFALTNPAFQSVLTDLVPSPLHAQAVLVYYMGINVTRVLGPALGGGLLSFLGPSSAFTVNMLSFLGLIIFFWLWPVPSTINPSEQRIVSSKDWQSIFSFQSLKLWVEIFIVTFFASALWALYPLRGRIELSLNSLQYGSLLGFLGLGACLSAVLSHEIMRPERTPKSLGASYLVYALGLLLLAMATNYGTMCAAMFLAGTGWLVLATLMNMSSRQVTSQSPLKATMMGVFMSVFYAGMSLGSVFWGFLASLSTSHLSLTVAAVGLAMSGALKIWSVLRA